MHNNISKMDLIIVNESYIRQVLNSFTCNNITTSILNKAVHDIALTYVEFIYVIITRYYTAWCSVLDDNAGYSQIDISNMFRQFTDKGVSPDDVYIVDLYDFIYSLENDPYTKFSHSLYDMLYDTVAAMYERESDITNLSNTEVDSFFDTLVLLVSTIEINIFNSVLSRDHSNTVYVHAELNKNHIKFYVLTQES
jgi:hypothetical protein